MQISLSKFSIESKTGFFTIKSDRAAAILVLMIPVIVLFLSFLTATVVTAMGVMEKGSFRFYLGAISYTALLAGFFFCPSYLISIAWFTWRSKQAIDLQELVSLFGKVPFVMAAFVWCPAFFVPQAGKLQVFVALLLIVIFVGYPFMMVARSILRRWRSV